MKNLKIKFENSGSALILTVVLTSLLAILGIMFVMAANMEKLGTSAVTANKELNFAVDSVVAEISQQLINDVPGVDKTDPNAEYYDYPGIHDRWLASLEIDDSNNWPQVSDILGSLPNRNVNTRIIKENEPIILNNGNIDRSNDHDLADADGDGISDSKWIQLRDSDITASGKQIFAAIRIIDNGGMINVNTGYKFDVDSNDLNKINGANLWQVNLTAFSERGSNTNPENNLQLYRCGTESNDINLYETNVIWRYDKPNGKYTPFDITDELEMRYRFLVDQADIDTRLEVMWDNAFQVGVRTPFTNAISDWPQRARYDSVEPNIYSYRHLVTAYNMDRIIDPNGQKMLVLDNNTPAADLENVLLNSGLTSATASQLAVNIRDYLDDNNDVSVSAGHYGFEPQPFISEIGTIIGADPCDINQRHYAVELYNPFDTAINLNGFELEVIPSGNRIPLSGTIDANSYYIVVNHGSHFATENATDSGLVLSDNYSTGTPPTICSKEDVLLVRDVGGTRIYLDRQDTDMLWFIASTPGKYFERDNKQGHILYQQVDISTDPNGTLGHPNTKDWGDLNDLEKRLNIPFKVGRFATVGELSRMLIIGPDTNPNNTIGRQLELAGNEGQIRVDLTNTNYQNIFRYLISNPSMYSGNDPNQIKVKGRININTAAWYVIAQLPWMQYDGSSNSSLIRAGGICTNRDTNNGFTSIGQIMRVPEMQNLAIPPDSKQNLYTESPKGPDFTPDSALDDFEERDLIFSRISNLITVRSDVFSAYILVRLGVDGPQKRVIAILDRSDIYPQSGGGSTGKVKIVALWPVPDAR